VLIGFDREARGHAAGLRTTILVALSGFALEVVSFSSESPELLSRCSRSGL
jgi:uncharacterized membrane protein YhiD involved in acid resistance